ncbi:CynX/NimT family MFS transporter [Paenibacillus taichungensis]|uniref:CynX/NimT family MFS transporter n=1 Tax=Paenibacillus taichungensis TaxID=484184 RepID=UPI0035DF53B4
MSVLSDTNSTIGKKPLSLAWPIILGIVLIAMIMRSPLTSVGPLIGSIRESLGLSNATAGLLTTLPLLAFALLSPFAPFLARRLGVERTLLYALVLLIVGIAIRSLAATASLFAGTALIGLAIAVCNVLIPSLVKRNFAHQVGLMTGVYSVSMNLSGAIASGVSVPVARDLGFGWNGALGIWGVLVLLAALFWLPQARASRGSAIAATSGVLKRRSLWRSPLAWMVTIFMGMQSLLFYVLVAWLPEIMTSRGLSEDSAGWMLSLFQTAALPVAFIVPIVAGRMKNQRLLVIIMTILLFVSLGGLYFGGNALISLWTVLLGIGGGCAFSLAMIFLSLRTKDAHDTVSLSGMSQSVGYLLAATGPILFGLLHDIAASWNPPLLLLLVVSALLLLFGLGASSNRTV